MKRLLVTALTISAYVSTSAQDTLRSVHYENLKQVSFHHLKKIDSAELKGVKFFYGASSDLFFECLIPVTQDSSIINQKEFDRSLQIFIEGFSSSESWKYYQREQVDTTLGGVEGILVHYYASSKPVKIQEFYNFFTIVNKKNYVIAVGSINELTPAIKKEIDDVFETVRFEGKNY